MSSEIELGSKGCAVLLLLFLAAVALILLFLLVEMAWESLSLWRAARAARKSLNPHSVTVSDTTPKGGAA